MTARRALVVAVPAALLLAAPTARATYSIVATDRTTRQVGGAVTSCVGNQDVAVVIGLSPGHGGIHAQAAANTAGRDRGVVLLGTDTPPADIIAMITAASFDTRANTRQYGVADLMGRAAGFTGTGAQNYKEDRQGTIDAYTYSAQGNILTSVRVLDQAEAAFRAGGCDLPERLMLALEGGAQNGEGDSRCTGPKMIPSDSAAITVDLPDMPTGSYLRVSVRGTGTTNPLVPLRTMFNTWRATHPCTPTGTMDAGATTDAGTRTDAGTGREAATGSDAAAADRGAGTGAGGGSGGAGSGGATGSGGSAGNGGACGSTGAGGQLGTGGNSTGGTGSPKSGCNCALPGIDPSAVALLYALAALLWVTRSRSRQH